MFIISVKNSSSPRKYERSTKENTSSPQPVTMRNHPKKLIYGLLRNVWKGILTKLPYLNDVFRSKIVINIYLLRDVVFKSL